MNRSITEKLNEKIICQKHDSESLNFMHLGAGGGEVWCGSCTLTENYIQIRQKLAPMLEDYKKQRKASIPEDEAVSTQLKSGCELVSAKIFELEEYIKRWHDIQLQLVEALKQQAIKCIARKVKNFNATILNLKNKVAAYDNLLSDPIQNICKNYQPNYPNLKNLASFLKDKIVLQKINEEYQPKWNHLEEQFVNKQKAKDKLNSFLQSLDELFVKKSLNLAIKDSLLQNLDVQLLNKYIWDYKSDPSIKASQGSFLESILDDTIKLKMKKLYSHLLSVCDLSTCSNQLKTFLNSLSLTSLDTQNLTLCQLQHCGNEFKTLGLNISLIAKHLHETEKWQLNHAYINNLEIPLTSTLVFFDNMRSNCYVKDGIIQINRDQQPTQLIPTQQDLRNSTRPAIWSLSVSYDGQHLASGGEDKNVIIWDLNTYKQISALSGHQNEIRAIAFSNDGKLLASAEGDQNNQHSKGSQSYAIYIWDLKDQSLLRKLDIEKQPCQAIAFAPNGKHFAAASEQGRDPKICLWTIEKDWEPKILSGHKKPIRRLNFSPDSRFLASGSCEENQPIIIWDTELQSQIARFGKLEALEYIQGINFSADCKYVAFSYRQIIQICRMHSNSQAPEITLSDISSINQAVFLQKFASSQSQNLDTLILELVRVSSKKTLPKSIKLLNNSVITFHSDSTIKKPKND